MAGWAWESLIWRERAGEHWSAEARLLGAYLLSGPPTNRIGCFALDHERIAAETGLPADRIPTILAELESRRFVRFDSAAGWVWIDAVLAREPFADAEEVRRALPALAAVPRDVAFYGELVQSFRASADRPGAGPRREAPWIAGLIGEDPALALADRLAGFHARLRRTLPGLPLVEASSLRRLASRLLKLNDYIKRCRLFLRNLVNTRPLRILGIGAIIATVLFIIFPEIDLGVASIFYAPPRSFVLGDTWIGRFFDTDIHYGMEWFIPVLVGAFLYGQFRGRPVLGLTRKRFLFVALSIALGAGLLTNSILKDNWGRARPSQIVEFGGVKQFTPPFMRSRQCDHNCSFVSGDASLAASFMAFAVIAERNRRRWWLALGGFTALVGLMRMARGSHFLSDVVFAVILTLMVIRVLERLILDDRWRAWPRWRNTDAVPED